MGDNTEGAVIGLNKLRAYGRNLIDGPCQGDISIAKGANATSVILS